MDNDKIFETYCKELEEDLKINQLNLKDKSLVIPGIKHKWVSRLIRHKQNLISLKQAKKQTKQKIAEELGKAHIGLSLPTLDKKAEEHELIQKVNNSISNEELIIEYLEKVLDVTKTISYDVRNIVDIIKIEET